LLSTNLFALAPPILGGGDLGATDLRAVGDFEAAEVLTGGAVTFFCCVFCYPVFYTMVFF
jgi:hypothetical protein